jgi:hypothetical protein
MARKIAQYLPFYLGCNSNKGKITGINQNCISVQSAENNIIEYDIDNADFIIKPYLRNLHSLTKDESTQLINKGMNIGRPKGYSFHPDAFLYLLTMRIDIFGLIESGLAVDVDDKAPLIMTAMFETQKNH